MSKICTRAALSKFSESSAPKNWIMCPPKNMKNFIVKIKILKCHLVLIRHQFLRNAQIEVHFSKIRNPNATRLQGSFCLDVKSTLAQIKNSIGAIKF